MSIPRGCCSGGGGGADADQIATALSSLGRLSILRPAPLRTRLWQCAGLLTIWTLTLAIGNLLLPEERAVTSRMLGHDFLPFYSAGTFVRVGRPDLMYDLDAGRNLQQAIAAKASLEIGDKSGPWWNPPFFALPFVPLSTLSYPVALAYWTLFGAACLAAACWLLVRMLGVGPSNDWKTWGLVPLLVLLAFPFQQAISHGQNTFLSLLIVAGTVTLWRQERAVLAGLCLAILAYKPQLCAVLAGVMTLSLGPRVLIGFIPGVAALAGAGEFFVPGGLHDWLTRLPQNLRALQVDQVYMWERHATLRAFWRLLVQGRGPGEYEWLTAALWLASAGVIGVALVRTTWVVRRDLRPDTPWWPETRAIKRDRLIAATILCTPLLMPFYFDYDLLLLAVPATLLAAERLRQDETSLAPRDKALTWVWAALFGWLMINPGMTAMTTVNGTVVLLGTLAWLHLSHATPAFTARDVRVDPVPQRVTIRRAA